MNRWARRRSAPGTPSGSAAPASSAASTSRRTRRLGHVVPGGHFGAQLPDELADREGRGDQPMVQVPDQPAAPGRVGHRRVGRHARQPAERQAHALGVCRVQGAGIGRPRRIGRLRRDRDLLHVLAEHPDRRGIGAGQPGEEALHVLIPLAPRLVGAEALDREALDGGGRAHRHQRRVTPGVLGLGHLRQPILPGAAQMGLQAAHQQRDVGAQGAAVGVDFVEHQVAAAVVGEDAVPVGRPHQQVLQHHVVGEQDVRRVPAQRLALRLARAPVVLRHRHHTPDPCPLEILLDADELVVGQRVHRVDQDRRQPRPAVARRVLQRVLDHRQQERLGLAGAGAGGDDHGAGGQGPGGSRWRPTGAGTRTPAAPRRAAAPAPS